MRYRGSLAHTFFIWGHMFQGDENGWQPICGGFDSHWLHCAFIQLTRKNVMKKCDKKASKNEVETNEVETKEVDYSEKIKSQLFEKIGNPPRIHRIDVSQHHNRNYRVNIWQRPEPKKNDSPVTSPVIAWSYYLRLSDTGEIISSDPPLTKIEVG